MRYGGLYLVTPDYTPGKFFGIVESAIAGGVDILQYRDKSNTKQVRMEVAGRLRSICSDNGIPFIVNDDIDITVESEADGIHIGTGDTPYAEARERMNNGVVGVSVYGDIELALKYERMGADYVSFGPFFDTDSKKDASVYDIGVLEEARSRLTVPVFVIGGITAENISKVISCGVDGVAVISAIFRSADPESAARELKRLIAGRKC